MSDILAPIELNTPDRSGLIVIRTHYLDDTLFDRAAALRSDGRYEVAFAIDERRREWDSRDFPKIPLTAEIFSRLGLFAEDASFLWRLGDYVFYAARRTRPDADFIWLLENDVAVNAADPAEPFRRLDAASRHDLLASHVGEADAGWFWHRSMAGRFREVRRCFFPVVRLSRRAIDRLYGLRAVEGVSYAALEAGGGLVPNDEAFVATVLEADGFSSADLNAFGDFYSAQTLDFYTLFDVHALPPFDGRFYHAALEGRAFLDKLARMPAPDLGMVLDAAFRDAEVGIDECADDVLRALDVALASTGDDEELVMPGGVVDRMLSLSPSGRMLGGIACCLGAAGKEAALVRLARRQPDHPLAGRGRLENVARNRPASQSSTCTWSRHRDPVADASEANNGDRRAELGCHTDEEHDPWWQVDLGTVHSIHAIEIINRRHMADRLAGFRVDASRDGSSWEPVHQDAGAGPTPVRIIIEPTEPLSCRWLRITVPGRAILHIVEFATFGTPAGAPPGRTHAV